MSKIHRLSPHEAHKIAAGEVVERPANVAKELIENALDAGATQITIYIRDGGKELIRVIDNGCGMSSDDARLSIEHHATSKITTVDDLKTLQTFGFRGEALSSICAVSNVTLCTKESDTLHGIKLTIETGVITSDTPASSNTGTDIAISNLFYNVPARKKFLKKRETEFNQIQQLVHALCLLHRHVHFKLFHDDLQLLNCPPVDSITARFTQMFDHSWTHHMLELSGEQKNIQLSGAISNHQNYRYDRNHIFLFVNKRWIKNYTIGRALLKGYTNVLPAGRFPAACIDITINPGLVDINIHPRKEEVQFLNPRTVENLIADTVKARLEEHLSHQLKKPITFASAQPMEQPWNPTFTPINFNPLPTPITSFAFDKPVFVDVEQEAIIHERQKSIVQAPPIAESVGEQHQNDTFSHDFLIIGQYKKTYILIEREDGLFLVDQHAAHERVLYELFSKRFQDIPTIKLLFPHLITITQHDLAELVPYLHIFEQNGIMIEPFSDNQLIIQSTPVHLKDHSCEDLIKQVIGWIQEYNALEEQLFFKTIHEKLHAQMACKAAVKAGDVLPMQQMQQLLADLNKSANRLTCPHGRPTGWLLSLHDIEKKFKRKV